MSALLKDIHVHLGCLYKLTECIAMSLSPSLSLCLSVQRRICSAQGHPRSPRLSLQADEVHRDVSKPVSLSLCLSVQRRVCSAQGHPRSPRLSLQADGVHRDVSKPVSLSVSLCPASCPLCSRTSTFTSAVSTS